MLRVACTAINWDICFHQLRERVCAHSVWAREFGDVGQANRVGVNTDSGVCSAEKLSQTLPKLFPICSWDSSVCSLGT